MEHETTEFKTMNPKLFKKIFENWPIPLNARDKEKLETIWKAPLPTRYVQAIEAMAR